MDEWEIVLVIICDWFRRNPKTSWGKNQLLECLDGMRDKIKGEKE